MRERAGDKEKRSNDESESKDLIFDIIEGKKVLVARWVCEDGEYYFLYTRLVK